MPSLKEAKSIMTCQDLINKLAEMGWSQIEMARALGVTVMTVYRYSKQDKIKKSNLAKLKRLYIRAKNPKYQDLEKFDTVDLVRALRSRGWEVTITDDKKIHTEYDYNHFV